MKRNVTLLFTSILYMIPCFASDVNGQYAIIGHGTSSCGTFVTEQKNQLAVLSYHVWLGGFLTATNIDSPNIYSILGSTDMEGAYQWMNNYCTQNSLKTVSEAAQALAIELSSKRTRKAN